MPKKHLHFTDRYLAERSQKLALKDLSSPEYSVAENDANRLMHINLRIGRTNMLMGSDALEIMGQVTEADESQRSAPAASRSLATR